MKEKADNRLKKKLIYSVLPSVLIQVLRSRTPMPHSLIITFAMFIVRSFLERSDNRSTLVMVYKFNNIYLSRRNYIGIFCKSNYFSVFLSHVCLESTSIITIVFSAFHMLLCFKKSAKQQMQGKKGKQNKTRQNKNRMEEIWKYLFVHCLFVSWRVTICWSTSYMLTHSSEKKKQFEDWWKVSFVAVSWYSTWITKINI